MIQQFINDFKRLLENKFGLPLSIDLVFQGKDSVNDQVYIIKQTPEPTEQGYNTILTWFLSNRPDLMLTLWDKHHVAGVVAPIEYINEGPHHGFIFHLETLPYLLFQFDPAAEALVETISDKIQALTGSKPTHGLDRSGVLFNIALTNKAKSQLKLLGFSVGYSYKRKTVSVSSVPYASLEDKLAYPNTRNRDQQLVHRPALTFNQQVIPRSEITLTSATSKYFTTQYALEKAKSNWSALVQHETYEGLEVGYWKLPDVLKKLGIDNFPAYLPFYGKLNSLAEGNDYEDGDEWMQSVQNSVSRKGGKLFGIVIPDLCQQFWDPNQVSDKEALKAFTELVDETLEKQSCHNETGARPVKRLKQ